MQSTYVSIIIPTYNDWRRLSLCLAALSGQTYPKEKFEVILINNNPNDSIPAGFSLPDGYKIITEMKPGSYAARNAGLNMAKGQIIGFTDSDCIPDADWIKNAILHFQANKSCCRIAGKVVVFPKTSKYTMAEKYDKLYAFRQQRYVANSGTCVTANMFSYKSVFDAVGLFDENQLSWGDLNWGTEAQKAGYPIEYVDNVVVNHPARSWKELIKKEKRLAGGIGMRERDNKSISIFNFLNEYRPRLAEIKFVYRHGSHLDAIDKIKILLMRHYLLGLRAFERFKVRRGKIPNRA